MARARLARGRAVRQRRRRTQSRQQADDGNGDNAGNGTGGTASCRTAPSRSATWPSQATPAPARPRCSKPCCMPAARSSGRLGRARHHGLRPRSDGEGARALAQHRDRVDRPRRHPHQPDRHARASRISAARRCRRSPRSRPCAVVVNAADGIEHGTRADDGVREGAPAVPRDRRQQDRRTNPASLADAGRRSCATTFGPECLPINLPREGGTARRRLLLQPARRGDADFASVAEAHQRIIDQVVEINEDGDGPLPRRRRSRPVGAGAARRVRAVPARGPPGADLLRLGAHRRRREGTARPRREAVAEPARGQSAAVREGQRRDAEPIEPTTDPEEARDRRRLQDRQRPVRRQARASSASTRARSQRDTQLFIDDGKKPFKVGHLFKLQGQGPRRDRGRDPRRHRRGREDRGHPLRRRAARQPRRGRDPSCKPLDFPQPMFGLAIEPRAQGPGAEAVDGAAQARRGGSRASASSTTRNSTRRVVRGLGELHLRLMIERMKERYGVEVKIAAAAHRLPRDDQRAAPKAITGTRSRPAAPASSARCSCASSRCRAAPASSSSTRSRAARSRTSSSPPSRRACARCCDGGAIAGYQLQDVRVIVYDGKYHPVDSKEVAFVAAGKQARSSTRSRRRGRSCSSRSSNLDVAVPEAHMGDVTGGLASKRARINGTDSTRGGEIVIKAQVPLAEIERLLGRAEGAHRGPRPLRHRVQPLRAGAGAGAAQGPPRLSTMPDEA